MKIYIRFFLLIGWIISLQNKIQGQDVLYSQTNFHQLYINPSYAGNSPYPRLMAGYRNQWPGLGNAYVSYYVSYDQYVKNLSSNLGVSLDRDVQGNGVISRTSGNLCYSYPVDLSQNTMVSLGFQFGIVQKRLDPENLQLPDNNPYTGSASGEAIPARSKIFPDFSAGATFYLGEQYLLGFAVHHLNAPQETDGSNYNYATPMRLSIQALANIPMVKRNRSINNVSLNPGIYAQVQQNFNFITWGSNLNYNGLISGLWFRNNLKLNLNTVIVQLGYSNGAYCFVYSFDAWTPLNNQQFKFYGAHEVTFTIHFKYNDPKKKMKTIKCPKISR